MASERPQWYLSCYEPEKARLLLGAAPLGEKEGSDENLTGIRGSGNLARRIL